MTKALNVQGCLARRGDKLVLQRKNEKSLGLLCKIADLFLRLKALYIYKEDGRFAIWTTFSYVSSSFGSFLIS